MEKGGCSGSIVTCKSFLHENARNNNCAQSRAHLMSEIKVLWPIRAPPIPITQSDVLI